MSEWPSSFLLDEIWLKAHRTLVHTLEAKNLWIDVQTYKHWLNREKNLGTELKEAILPEVLGKDDYAIVHSEIIFGRNNAVFKRKLPLSLGFGYEIGFGFSSLSSEDHKVNEKLARLSSLFNLGISLFDFILDNSTVADAKPAFEKIFDADLLKKISADSQACDLLHRQSQRVKTSELRILLKIISFFYLNLHALKKTMKDNSSFTTIMALLKRSYTSEIMSQRLNNASANQLTKIASAKSILPFKIIQKISCSQSSLTNKVQFQLEKLSTQIGNIFWLVDDLSDIGRDFQAKSLNYLLLPLQKDRDSEEKLTRLLINKKIELIVKKISLDLLAAEKTICQMQKKNQNTSQFNHALLFYLRDWLN